MVLPSPLHPLYHHDELEQRAPVSQILSSGNLNFPPERMAGERKSGDLSFYYLSTVSPQGAQLLDILPTRPRMMEQPFSGTWSVNCHDSGRENKAARNRPRNNGVRANSLLRRCRNTGKEWENTTGKGRQIVMDASYASCPWGVWTQSFRKSQGTGEENMGQGETT